MTDVNEQRRLKDNLQGEIDGAAVYAALAEAEKDPNVASIYRRLAAVERAHGEVWRPRLDRARARTAFPPSLRAPGCGWLGPRLGSRFLTAAVVAGGGAHNSP